MSLAQAETDLPEEDPTVRVIRVGAGADVGRMAKTIMILLRQEGVQRVDVRSIGAGATNQAVKAIAIARDYDKSLDIIVRPYMSTTFDITRTPENGAKKLVCIVQELRVLR